MLNLKSCALAFSTARNLSCSFLSPLSSRITLPTSSPSSLANAVAAATSQVRHATKKASSHSRNGKRGPGKRRGCKRFDGDFVAQGNILVRQVGKKFNPGHNCHSGKDHTIHASVNGWVRYYKDPAKPQCRYIGIVTEANHRLPYLPGAAVGQPRYLNMVDVGRQQRELLEQQAAYRIANGEAK